MFRFQSGESCCDKEEEEDDDDAVDVAVVAETADRVLFTWTASSSSSLDDDDFLAILCATRSAIEPFTAHVNAAAVYGDDFQKLSTTDNAVILAGGKNAASNWVDVLGVMARCFRS